MRLKPVYLGFTNCPIGKLHHGSSFSLAPATFAVRAVQIAPDVYSSASGDCLDISDLSEDLELHHISSLLRYPAGHGESASLHDG